MGVDADLQPILDLIAATEQPPPMEAGPQFARDAYAMLCVAFGAGDETVDVSEVELVGRAGAIPARRYRPAGRDVSRAAPTLVYLHGGGFVIGSLDTHDALCRSFASQAGVDVISVGYRLAPEHPAPAAVDDATDALDDVLRRADEFGVDPARVAIGGDSAGGNLAAVVARRRRDTCRADPTAAPLRFQLLIYPVVDQTSDAVRFPSLEENGEGYLLTRESMEFFHHHYLSGDDSPAPDSPDVSPLSAEDLTGCAPAMVLTAEFDPLRDEGEAYAQRLADAGVPVIARRYDGAIHAFVQMGLVTGIGARAVADCSEALREALVDDAGAAPGDVAG